MNGTTWTQGGRAMDIGPLRRIIEVEPFTLPVPEEYPEPATTPVPAEPEPSEPGR